MVFTLHYGSFTKSWHTAYGRAQEAVPVSPCTPPRSGDLAASVTVFLIAVPMSLGLAVAMGAPLQAGLIATAVGGILGGLLGGAPSRSPAPPPG